jgi:hypothetical protein
MPDPPEELITILMEIHNGTRQARPSGRLRPLLVGPPQPKRRMVRWGDQATISAALAPSRRHRFQRLNIEVLVALAF